MDTTMAVERDAPVTPVEIAALRVAVGWDADEASYVKSLKRFHAHYTVRIEGRLVGFLAVVSDGVSNALLVDVIVHPLHQRRGVGQALVKRAVHDLKSEAVRCIHVTFAPPLENFYRGCGFNISKGGFIDFKTLSQP